jgi:hypothetical protein
MSFYCKRRDFLTGSFKLTLGVLLNQNLNRASSDEEKYFGLAERHDDDGIVISESRLIGEQGHKVTFLHLKDKKFQIVSVPSKIHKVIQHPLEKNKFFAICDKGLHQSCEIILDQNQVFTKVVSAGDKRTFFGHGTFDQSGKYLYATEKNLITGFGEIVKRDAQNNYDICDIIETDGIGPHDIGLLVGSMAKGEYQEKMIVAHGGLKEGPASYTDRSQMEREKILGIKSQLSIYENHQNSQWKEVENYSADSGYSIRHLDTFEHDFAFIETFGVLDSKSSDYSIDLEKVRTVKFFIHEKNKISEGKLEPKFQNAIKHHSLSVAINRRLKICGVTHPNGNLVTFWDMESGEFLRSISINQASGITSSIDQNSFFVSSVERDFYQVKIISLNQNNFKFLLIPLHLNKNFLPLTWGAHLSYVKI